MSHKLDIEIINSFVGKTCERTLACNSIKLQFECDVNPKGTSYIWIDAPWEFQTETGLVTESSDYPDHEKADYGEKFKKWSDLLSPLNNTTLYSLEYTKDNELQLEFEDGYYIYVPFCPSEEKDDWYDHWYAKNS